MRFSKLWLLPLLLAVMSAALGGAKADEDGGSGVLHRWFHHHHPGPRYLPAPGYYQPPVTYYQAPPTVYYQPPPPVYEQPPPTYYVQPAPYSPYGKHTPAHECRTQAGECQLPGPEFAGRGCKCFFQGYGNIRGIATP